MVAVVLYLFLDVDDANHLVQVFARVFEKLLHLQIGFDLVELLDLLHGLDQLLDLTTSSRAAVQQVQTPFVCMHASRHASRA
jgi:uncharacterized protein Smg (DUF494 family)